MDGAWYFSDFDRTLLGPISFSILNGVLSDEAISNIENLWQLYIENTKPLSLKETQLTHQEYIKESAAEIARDYRIAPVYFDTSKITISPEISIMQIGQIPWLPGTWECLADLGFGEQDKLGVLDGLSWANVLQRKDEAVYDLLDILQMVFDWLPFSLDHSLTPAPNENLDKQAQLFSKSLVIRSGLSINSGDRWNFLMSERNGWGVKRKTLEEIASIQGVTRERVRQIEEALSITAASRTSFSPQILEKVFRLDYGAKVADPMVKLKQALTFKDDWTFSSLCSFFNLRYSNDVTEKLIELSTLSDDADNSAKKIQSAIRKSRTKLGIVKLDAIYMSGSTEPMNAKHVLEHLRQMYPYVNAAGDFAIAGPSDSTAIINSISTQLAVRSPLNIEQIQTGVRKRAVQLQAQDILPDTETLKSLLEADPNFNVDSEGNVSGRIRLLEDDSVQGWLVSQLRNSPGEVQSKAELLRLAIADGLSLNSVTTYFLTSPICRSLGDGYISLVGASPNQNDIDFVESVAAASYVANQIVDYKQLYEPPRIKVRFLFSTPFLISGVIPIDKTLSSLLGKATRSLNCCEKFSSRAQINVSHGSNWHGFAGIREHLILEHSIGEGSIVTLEINGEIVSVIH